MKRHTLRPGCERLEERALLSAAHGSPAVQTREVVTHVVVCEGNSLTFGAWSSDPPTKSYPAQLQARLGHSWAVLNLGGNAETTEQMVFNDEATFSAISELASRFRSARANPMIDVLWEGTNSLLHHDTGAKASRLMEQLISQREAEGFKVIVLTCLPGQSPGSWFEAQRRVYNSLILQNAAHADAVVDVASDPHLTNDLSPYYAPDHFHLNDAGYAVVAGLVSQAVQRLS